MKTTGKPNLHILLTEGEIVCANQGTPFTQEGLRAACRALTGPRNKKAQRNTTAIASQNDAKKYMEEIWQAWIEDYKRRPDAPARHAEAERDIGEKLKGLLLREFIANAHDTNAGTDFGGKGIGLRTLLSICDRPRFHSGHMSFCFDRKLGQKALTQGLGKIKQADTPLMRLPFPIGRSREPARIKRLIDEFDTVVILPFRNKATRAEFVKEWDRFVDDATTLLHLPALGNIIWERDDSTEKTKRTWVRGDKPNSVQMVDEGKRASIPRIRIRPAPQSH